MTYFQLPTSTIVNKFIPKSAFDEYTNTNQKAKLVKYIDKITWLNNLSISSLNLDGTEVKEIQIFEIRLKLKDNIQPLLNIIEKAIPYHIIFIISYKDEFYISTTQKHNHSNNQDKSVLDWTFSTVWQIQEELKLTLNLKNNLDYIYLDFCSQIAGYYSDKIEQVVESSKEKAILTKQLQELERKIRSEKQFNIKVELHNQRKEIQKKLNQ